MASAKNEAQLNYIAICSARRVNYVRAIEIAIAANELPSSAVLRKDQAHFTEPRGLARGLNTTNENQNLLHQAIRPSSGWQALDIAPVRWGK